MSTMIEEAARAACQVRMGCSKADAVIPAPIDHWVAKAVIESLLRTDANVVYPDIWKATLYAILADY